MGFSRQESWSKLPFPPPGNLPDDPGMEPGSPTLQKDSLPPEPPINVISFFYNFIYFWAFWGLFSLFLSVFLIITLSLVPLCHELFCGSRYFWALRSLLSIYLSLSLYLTPFPWFIFALTFPFARFPDKYRQRAQMQSNVRNESILNFA